MSTSHQDWELYRRGWRNWLPIGVFCAVYTVMAIGLFLALGYRDAAPDFMFSNADSREYLAIADFIAHRGSAPDASIIALRPIIYPLFLSLHHIVGFGGICVLQWLCNLVTLAAIFFTVRSVTRRSLFAILACLVIALQPTFTFITLHAMTESFAICLISLAVYFVVGFHYTNRLRSFLIATFFFSAAVCTRPAFLPAFVVWFAIGGFLAFRHRQIQWKTSWILIPALLPLIVQLSYTGLLTGRPTISTAGRANLEVRFFPAVHGFATRGVFLDRRNPLSYEARREFPTHSEKVSYVITHPIATISAIAYLLRHNLVSSSDYVGVKLGNHPATPLRQRIRAFSLVLNKLFVVAHIFGLGGVIYILFWGDRHLPKALYFILACSVGLTILGTALTYWQGDRLILAATPFWIVLYSLIIHSLGRGTPQRRVTTAGSTTLARP